jgi:hypothetical protein
VAAFNKEFNLEIKIWVLDVFVAAGISLLLDPEDRVGMCGGGVRGDKPTIQRINYICIYNLYRDLYILSNSIFVIYFSNSEKLDFTPIAIFIHLFYVVVHRK